MSSRKGSRETVRRRWYWRSEVRFGLGALSGDDEVVKRQRAGRMATEGDVQSVRNNSSRDSRQLGTSCR